MRYHNFAIRTQDWKLLHNSGFGPESFTGQPHFELYDMRNDPFEMNNVAVNYPEKVAELRKAYDAWFDDVSSTRPDNYDPPRIYIGTPHENPVVLTHRIGGTRWVSRGAGIPTANGCFMSRTRDRMRLWFGCVRRSGTGTWCWRSAIFGSRRRVRPGRLRLRSRMFA